MAKRKVFVDKDLRQIRPRRLALSALEARTCVKSTDRPRSSQRPFL